MSITLPFKITMNKRYMQTEAKQKASGIQVPENNINENIEITQPKPSRPKAPENQSNDITVDTTDQASITILQEDIGSGSNDNNEDLGQLSVINKRRAKASTVRDNC
jgi:hypothetical protein